MAKGGLIRALMGMKHSPAGKKYLAKQKKETQSVYFKNIKRTSNIQRLKDAGLSDADLRSLGIKK